MATARAARCSPRWVHRHLPAARSACALIRATRTAGPLLWTTGTTTSVTANIGPRLHVHITSMKMPSAWWRRAR
jgi:hypothetical protein